MLLVWLGYDTAIPYMNMLWALDSAEAMDLPIAGTKWTATSGYARPVFGKGYSAQVYPEYFRHGAYSPGKLATGLNSVFFPLLAADHARRMADPGASTAQRVVDGGMVAANVAGTAGTAANALQYGRWAWAPKVMGASGALNVAGMAIQHYTDQINNGNAALDAYGKAKEQAGGARRSTRPSSEWTGQGKNPAEVTAEMEQWAHKNRAATVNDAPGDTDRTDYDTTHMFGRDMMPSFQQWVPIGGTAWFGHTPLDPVRAANLLSRQQELDRMAGEAIDSYAPEDLVQVPAYPTGTQVTIPAREYIDHYRNALKMAPETDPRYLAWKHLQSERMAGEEKRNEAERKEQARKEHWDNTAEVLKGPGVFLGVEMPSDGGAAGVSSGTFGIPSNFSRDWYVQRPADG